MKRNYKILLLWILFLATVFVLFVIWDRVEGKRTSTKTSSTSSLNSQLSENLFGNALDRSVENTVKSNTAQSSQPQKTASIFSEKDVCDELAEGRKTPEDWKRFNADLRKKLDSTLPDLAKALEKASQTQNLVEKASALYLLVELKAAMANNVYTPNRAQCEANDACGRAKWDLIERARMESVNEIAKMAIYSSDAKLYMIAFNACNAYSDQDSNYCSQINARQWASRDPNNGMAWIHVLSQLPKVENGKSNSAVDEALFRIAQAKYFDGGYSILSNLNANPEMQFNDVFMRLRMDALASEAWSRTPLPSYVQVLISCKGDFLNNLNRRQTCNQIAEKWQRDDALALEFALTPKLGEYLGWDAARIANIRDEWYAIVAMLTLERQDAEALRKQPENFARKSCKDFLKQNQDLLKMVSEGELKQYRKNLAAQSRSRAELVAFALAERAKAKVEAK
jgi:hypothetical protein